MGLPLYLAMTGGEISGAREVPHPAWMACHFSPYGQALTNIPRELPEGAMLILNDRVPCQGHSPALAAQQLAEAVIRLGCDSVVVAKTGVREGYLRRKIDAEHPIASL